MCSLAFMVGRSTSPLIILLILTLLFHFDQPACALHGLFRYCYEARLLCPACRLFDKRAL